MKTIFILFLLTTYSAYAFGNNNKFHQCMEDMSTQITIDELQDYQNPTSREKDKILVAIANHLKNDINCREEFIQHTNQTAKLWQKRNDKEYAYIYNINDVLAKITFDRIAFWVFSNSLGNRYYPGDTVTLSDLSSYNEPWWPDMCSDWGVNFWSNVDDDAEMSIQIGINVFGDLNPDYKNDEFIIDVTGNHKFFPGMIYRDITGSLNDNPVYLKQYSAALKYYKRLTTAMSNSTYCKDQDVYLILPSGSDEKTNSITILHGPYKN